MVYWNRHVKCVSLVEHFSIDPHPEVDLLRVKKGSAGHVNALIIKTCIAYEIGQKVSKERATDLSTWSRFSATSSANTNPPICSSALLEQMLLPSFPMMIPSVTMMKWKSQQKYLHTWHQNLPVIESLWVLLHMRMWILGTNISLHWHKSRSSHSHASHTLHQVR